MLGATLGPQAGNALALRPQEGSVAVATNATGFKSEINTLSQEEQSNVDE